MARGNGRGPRRRWSEDIKLLGLGPTMAGCIGIGAGIGYLLDGRFNKTQTPWFTLVFTLLGIVAAFKALFQTVGPTKSRRK